MFWSLFAYQRAAGFSLRGSSDDENAALQERPRELEARGSQKGYKSVDSFNLPSIRKRSKIQQQRLWTVCACCAAR